MRRVVRGTLTVALAVLAAPGCYASHEAPAAFGSDMGRVDAATTDASGSDLSRAAETGVDAWVRDSTNIDERSDAESEDATAADGWVEPADLGAPMEMGHLYCSPCGPSSPPAASSVRSCNADEERRCQRWVAAIACGAVGRTRCVPGARGGVTCSFGDECTGDPVICRCNATRACGLGEVCVSDTPDGPARCRTACSTD